MGAQSQDVPPIQGAAIGHVMPFAHRADSWPGRISTLRTSPRGGRRLHLPRETIGTDTSPRDGRAYTAARAAMPRIIPLKMNPWIGYSRYQ